MTNGNLDVAVDAASGLLTATRVSDGAVLLAQTVLEFGAPDVPARPGAARATVGFAPGPPGERLYGFGQHRTGRVDMAGFAQRFADSMDYNVSHGTDVNIPFYMSSAGYAFLWNVPSYGAVNASAGDGIVWIANATSAVDMWISTGAYSQLLAQYADAVGHAPPMPYYATGFIQSKNRYRNQSQLMAVAEGYVARGLPIAVIVVDARHWVAWGDWTFNPSCWPDPAGMVSTLRGMGIETMVTFWPFQTTASRHFDAFNASGFLARDVSGGLVPYNSYFEQYLVDMTAPGARSAAFDAYWEGYGSLGIKTVWLDGAEPEHHGAALVS